MAFIMRQGQGKRSALYSRCADEKYCQAELLLLFDKAPPGPVVGSYDVDPSFPVSTFLQSYRGREEEINRALERVRRGEFNFQEDGIMKLVPGAEQKSPDAAEKKRRMDTVVATVEHYLPEFAKGVKKAAKEATQSGQEEQPMGCNLAGARFCEVFARFLREIRKSESVSRAVPTNWYS